MKITVMGYSGSGKSTLAARLGELYGLPVLHLDTVEFLPNWEKRERSEKEKIVGDFLRENGSWVIDWNYSKLFYGVRTEQADMIIILLFNRFVCLKRVISRYRKFKGKKRPDMANGCIEKLDLEFIRWVLHKGRTARKYANFNRLAADYPKKTVVIKNQKSLDVFLCELEK